LNQKIDSPIAKRSHCKQILSADDFDLHRCKWALKDVKQISVVYFRDDSLDDRKAMTGYGLDGILYTFVVTQRMSIPYMRSLSDDSYHDKNPTTSYQNRPDATLRKA
jgi:hypothetical protein